MKTIGLIGGMSWESTAEYYRIINREIGDRLGGQNSAKIVLHSVNFEEITHLQRVGDWDAAATILSRLAKSLEASGADLLLLCTNTMHLVAEQIQSAVQVPLLHIADALGEHLTAAGVSRVGLLGTRFTMEQDFYRLRLRERFGVEALIPESDERECVHRIIFDELCRGKVLEGSRDRYLQIVEGLRARGAQAAVLGCTEICLLIRQSMTEVPLYDTTEIHARSAVRHALGDDAIVGAE